MPVFEPVSNQIDFIAQEHRVLKSWDETQAFNKLLELRRGGQRWSFIDGPITANNPMGVHHGWGRTYKDLFQRFKSMQGFQLRYQNGFDCQGLWVEVNVERDMGFASSLCCCARSAFCDSRRSRLSKARDWAIGWNGTDLINSCGWQTS
jgi:isoleucyl-tRNA synthetase